MMKWFVLALAVFAGTESAPGDDPIPFSQGRGQIYASSDDLIKSFRQQKPKASELPAVVPADRHLPYRVPTTELEIPLESTSRGSHFNPRSARQVPVVTEQNTTPKSVGPEPSSLPNLGESIGQYHHVVPEEDSQLKSTSAPLGPIPGQFVILPVQVREVFPEHDSLKSDFKPPRPNLHPSIHLPAHVQEVPKEDSTQLIEPVLASRLNSTTVQQLSDQVLPPFIDTPPTLIPKTELPNSAQSVQQLPNPPQILPKQNSPLRVLSEPVRQDSGQSQHLAEQISIGQQDTLSSIVLEAPPRPNFDRSLHLRDDLSVPHSGYTEAYDIEWHKESNTARTVIENSTIIYRKLLLDGRIQYLEIKSDRTTGSEIHRCTMSPPLLPTSSIDTAFPGLPEIEPFQFSGYTTEEGRSQVEHWQYIVFGRPGQGGAAREESFNVTHDFFVYRDGSDAIPLRYTVTTDSSVLGPSSDTYTHRYRLLPTPTAPILPDTTQECDVLEELKDTERRRRTAGTVVGQRRV